MKGSDRRFRIDGEANDAVVRLLGAPNREALRQASPTKRFPERQPDGRPSIEKARALIKIVLGQGSLRFEWLVRCFDGTELPLDIVATAVPFDGRTLLSLVTERKRAEAELLRTQARETVTNSKQSEYCVSGSTFLLSTDSYGSRRQAFVTRLRTVVGGDSGRYSPDGGAGAS